MRIFSFVFTCVLTVVSSWADTRSELQQRSLRYFQDHAHPLTGLVRDRARNFTNTPTANRMASIAATGFGLAVLSHAASSGLLPMKKSELQVLKTLRFARDHVKRHKGWFLHFVDWETGTRGWNSEYSTIDTAIFVAGALYAGQVFDGEIMRIARQLHRDMDFAAFMTDEGVQPHKRTLSLSWTPEHGYVPYQWEIYAEQMVMLLLGLGHPSEPLPVEAWLAFKRQGIEDGIIGADMPLFVHQYSHAFVDFRQLDDGIADYFENSVRASRLHRSSSQQGFWGWSAGDSPWGYRAQNPTDRDGTLCIGCAIGSAMFLPNEVMSDANDWMNGPYAKNIWGRYGFSDSIHLSKGWFDHSVIGITVGPIYLSLANMDEDDAVWKGFMALPEIRRALARLR